MEFVDERSQNRFRLEQARGLPKGQRALIFLEDGNGKPFIDKEKYLCNYSGSLDRYYESKMKHLPCAAYAVYVTKKIDVIPSTLEPNNNNLGIFSNCILKSDPIRQKPNARLVVKNARKRQGAEISPIDIHLETRKRIRSGDEVLICYGANYVRQLKRDIEESKSGTSPTISPGQASLSSDDNPEKN